MTKIIILIVFYLLYFLMCYIGTGNDKKNLKAYRTYPTQVQELIKEKNEVKEPNLLYIFVCNTIFFSIIFFIISLVFKKY